MICLVLKLGEYTHFFSIYEHGSAASTSSETIGADSEAVLNCLFEFFHLKRTLQTIQNSFSVNGRLFEEGADEGGNIGDLDDLYALWLEFHGGERRDEYLLESQTRRFADTTVDLGDGTDLSA